MKKFLDFLSALILKLLSDVAYFLAAVLIIRLMEYAYDTINLYKFVAYLFCVTTVHDFYDLFINNILSKLFPTSYGLTLDDKGDKSE